MHGRWRALFVVVVCSFLTASVSACDGFVGILTLGPTGFTVVIIDPAIVVRQPGVAPGCPSVAPVARFDLLVRGAAEEVSLTGVTLQFADGSGAAGSPISYGPSDITRMFGSPVVSQGGARRFDFSVPYGCYPAAPTTMSAHVTLVTRAGRPIESDATAPFQ